MLTLSIDSNFLFHATPQPLWIFEINTLRYLEVNEAACLHYGYTRDEFLQLSIKDIRPAEDLGELERVLVNLSGNRTIKRSFRHLKKDGAIIHVEIVSYDVEFEGKAARLVMPIDVTEKLQNAARLANALAQMEQTLANISDGHFTLSNEGLVVSWNKSAEALTGVAKGDILYKNFWEVIPEAVKSGFYSHVEQAITSKTVVKFEEHFLELNKWFHTSIYPADHDVSIYFQDITEIKTQQQELKLKNQYLEEVAYFNSHELRRPLANIIGLYHLLSSADDAHLTEKEEIIHKIQLSCQDIDQVIQRIDQSHFARKQCIQ